MKPDEFSRRQSWRGVIPTPLGEHFVRRPVDIQVLAMLCQAMLCYACSFLIPRNARGREVSIDLIENSQGTYVFSMTATTFTSACYAMLVRFLYPATLENAKSVDNVARLTERKGR